jgi:hypothetical protein
MWWRMTSAAVGTYRDQIAGRYIIDVEAEVVNAIHVISVASNCTNAYFEVGQLPDWMIAAQGSQILPLA